MADLQKKNQEMIANIENIMTTTEATMKKTNNINSAATPLKSDKQAIAATIAESKATPAPATVKQEKMPSSIRNTSSSNPVTPLEEQISEGN
jgi:hypothetical protein